MHIQLLPLLTHPHTYLRGNPLLLVSGNQCYLYFHMYGDAQSGIEPARIRVPRNANQPTAFLQ